MKKNAKSIISMLSEYIVLIAPTAGLSIYYYQDTLVQTMSSSSKGLFWTLISISIVAGILFGMFKKKYDRYVQGYIQQKTDLEVNPQNELLVKKVAEKRTVVEQIDWVVALVPVLILTCVVLAFQNAIENLLIILWTVAGSIAAKIALHQLTIHFEKVEGIKNAKGGENE